MKITSLFSRASSSKIYAENNDGKTPISKYFSSPVSSPDIIPPSPVLEKKKAVNAKRSLNYLLGDCVEVINKSTISEINSIELVPKKAIDLPVKSPQKIKEDDFEVDSQSCYSTQSIASTVCDETDFCSDLVFDDWTDDYSSSVTK